MITSQFGDFAQGYTGRGYERVPFRDHQGVHQLHIHSLSDPEISTSSREVYFVEVGTVEMSTG